MPEGVTPGSAVTEFMRELRRRHVFRVVLAYGAVGWVVVQASDLLLPALQLPEWSVTLVTAVVILVFPVAVALAWAFDITPAGVQRTPARAGRTAPAAPATPRSGRGESLRAIAALPFVDRGAGAEHQFLGDGITEELITALARVPGLRVVSRTSSFAFRSDGGDVREIASRLGVGAMVEGSIRVSGDRLRMTVQLVDAADGSAIWSGTFDRYLDDVFAVQEEVARSIVAALRNRLGLAADPDAAAGGEAGPLVQRTASEVGAYSLYLQGRVHWNERTPESLRLAIRYFEEATARDPGFAHAYAGLADCHAILLDYGAVPPAAGLEPARAAAERALRLGPELAESHAAAALVKQMEWDWSGAEAEFRTAVALNPAYAPGRQRLALLLAWTGRTEEARVEIAEAVRYDPLSPAVSASVAWIDYFAGDSGAALAGALATLEQHPSSLAASAVFALAAVQAGRAVDAVAELERVLVVDGDGASTHALLVYALAAAGRAPDAARELERLRARQTGEFLTPYYMAVALVGTAEIDAALTELELAYRERAPQLVYLLREPIFSPLRGLPGFERIVGRLGFPSARKLEA